MPIPFEFDFKNPKYKSVINWRMERLRKIRENPKQLPYLFSYYKNNPNQFIIDWGNTYDPRNAVLGRPSRIPFLLYEAQEEWVLWYLERLKNRERGLTLKSREVGISWLAMATAVTLCLFNDGIDIGVISRKEMYVDKSDDPSSLLYKARFFLENLPKEFNGNWDARKSKTHMLIKFPQTNSSIIGEAGENAGRGGRTLCTFVDEAAFVPNPKSLEAALSATTPCRIDLSTPNGTNNEFYSRCTSGSHPIFKFHWTQDPRKDQEWYEKQCRIIDDPVTIAQELDLDFSASVDNILIPAEWVLSAIGADKKFKIKDPQMDYVLGFDVADKGADKNAVVIRRGCTVPHIESWSGKNGDIYGSVLKVFRICDNFQINTVYYDADGLGAGVRGDARVINRDRTRKIEFKQFVGSGAVVNPKADLYLPAGEVRDGLPHRKNEDYLLNAKAQGWWELRRRFRNTHRAVTEGEKYKAEDVIVLPEDLENLSQLVREISQPTYKKNENTGKMSVDKAPAGSKSPNLADALMIAFAPRKRSGDFVVFGAPTEGL